jgi:hypothetical protein
VASLPVDRGRRSRSGAPRVGGRRPDQRFRRWCWRARRDSNPRPSGPQPDALSTELRAPMCCADPALALRRPRRRCAIHRPEDLAEREGFEPSEQVTPLGGLANRCTRPLCDLSARSASGPRRRRRIADRLPRQASGGRLLRRRTVPDGGAATPVGHRGQPRPHAHPQQPRGERRIRLAHRAGLCHARGADNDEAATLVAREWAADDELAVLEQPADYVVNPGRRSALVVSDR